MDPHRTRLPLPLGVLEAIANFMVGNHQWQAAVGVMLGVCLYLRPGELRSIQFDQLIRPGVHLGYPSWSLVLNPKEKGIASKTGQYDDLVAVDGRLLTILEKPLLMLKSSKRASDFLMPLSAKDFNDLFKQACTHLHLQVLSPVPYHMRHSGASMDVAEKLRTLQ